jgi:hypothetical protein
MKNGLEIDQDGTKYYFLNNQLHREDGPAVIGSDGTQYWYLNGKRHRIDGPAVEWSSGEKYWYYHGGWVKCETQKQFEQWIKLRAFR